MSTETEWRKAIKDSSDNSTPPLEPNLLTETFSVTQDFIDTMDDDDPRPQTIIDILTDQDSNIEIFSETGPKINGLVVSDNIADVTQGLLLLETPNILQELFIGAT